MTFSCPGRLSEGADSGDAIGSYSIMQAESHEALGKALGAIRMGRWAAP